jgi:glucuronoarabinoxylan endo-1,4-beta-xylanase
MKIKTPLLSGIIISINIFISYGQSELNIKLSVDDSKTYQVIEGFGAFNTVSFWKDRPRNLNLEFIAKDLGLTMLRFELPPTFQDKKDGNFNLNGEVFGGPTIEQNFEDAVELHKLGVSKFIASVWSPPAWMKTVNANGKEPTTVNGGHLKKECYGDFANYCFAYCKAFKKGTGVELYAIGLQNEPEFVEPYNSCIVDPKEMKEILRVVGKKFEKEGITTKIFLPEVLPAQKHVIKYFKTLTKDPEISKYCSIFAIHNYDTDGIHVGGSSADQWKLYSQMAATASPSKQLWMTETSGHANSWEGAMLLASNIYNALNYGNINAWLWWAIADKKSAEAFALIVDGVPTSKYYVSKQFYHFIRPGAVRIQSSTNDSEVISLAFKNSGEYTNVTILINVGEKEKKIHTPEIGGKKPIVFLTNENKNCENQEVWENSVVTLPAKSIITLTW